MDGKYKEKRKETLVIYPEKNHDIFLGEGKNILEHLDRFQHRMLLCRINKKLILWKS